MKNSAIYTFRILAGGYLVYLGYTLAADFVKGESDIAGWMLVFPVLFLVAGLVLAITSLRGLRRDKMDNSDLIPEESPNELEKDDTI